MGSLLPKIARQAAEHYAKTGEYMHITWPLPPEFQSQKACFVSIAEQPGHHIRASFGTSLPRMRSLGEEIVHNTVEAIMAHNLRMRPVDTAAYTYTVAVIGPLERITSPEHLKPLSWGLYIRSEKNKTSLVLPRRPGIETAEEQIATAIREAGIDPRTDTPTMYRFSVTFHDS
jgi:AMMECR1 domain-containing protein